ncbi:MAG: hypothetical protein EON54_11250 [Alcaligenaceae bacterium]|nr:MAG: hypothetical protein EON54_11250 [Alcaligenaceae bacterium]
MPTIHTDHQPNLRGITLLANHEEYALTLEQHFVEEGKPFASAVNLHADFGTLSVPALARLANEFFALRLSMPQPLFALERTPNDAEFADFLGVYGFKPYQALPCADGQERRLFLSPAVGGAPTR